MASCCLFKVLENANGGLLSFLQAMICMAEHVAAPMTRNTTGCYIA